MNVHYLQVTWHQLSPDEPIELYSEVLDSWEVRKVEVYSDGHADYADEGSASGSTRLSINTFPAFEEIDAQAEFTPRRISKADFETVWDQAHRL